NLAICVGKLGPRAIDLVTLHLTDSRPDVRWTAVVILGHIGPAARDAVPELSKRLGDPNSDVALAAAITLGKIGPSALECLPDLVKQLGNPDQRLRAAVREALRDIEPAWRTHEETRKVLRAFIEQVSSFDPAFCSRAAQGLGEIGPAAAEAIPALSKC